MLLGLIWKHFPSFARSCCTSKKDIDIITNAENAKKIDQVLKEYVIQPSAFSATDKYQSYFGIYEIDGVNVEVMGEFRYRMKMENGQNQTKKTKSIMLCKIQWLYQY